MKVLIVEDDEEIRSAIVETLDYEGFQVFQAANGLLGLEQAHTHLPDLIISDVMMPEMTGFELLQELQVSPATAAIPFVFLTAYAEESLREEGIVLGVEHYLLKPFTIHELLEVIHAVIG